jgi:hypothetical protein
MRRVELLTTTSSAVKDVITVGSERVTCHDLRRSNSFILRVVGFNQSQNGRTFLGGIPDAKSTKPHSPRARLSALQIRRKAYHCIVVGAIAKPRLIWFSSWKATISKVNFPAAIFDLVEPHEFDNNSWLELYNAAVSGLQSTMTKKWGAVY